MNACRKSTTRHPLYLALVLFTMGLLAGPAAAQTGTPDAVRYARASLPTKAEAESRTGSMQAVYQAGELQALSQSMIIHSLLTALKIDSTENVDHLVAQRARFIRVMDTLNRGDESTGLQAAGKRQIQQKLDRLAREWAIFGPAVESIIETGKATPANVAIVAECIEPLAEATEELLAVVEHYATGGHSFSILTGMVSRAKFQHSLLNEMTAEYLLIAYGHQAEIYRIRLWAHWSQFDQTLAGLIDGNRRLQLLPAPHPRLKAQLSTARQIWLGLSPTMRGVANGHGVSRRSLARIASESAHLAVEIGRAVEMYRAL